jgi:uncharacterized protein YhbP (UPF0306 family)
MNDDRLGQLLAGRYIATLATWDPAGTIYLSAVWYLHRDGAILIGTAGTTRKARNAAQRPNASLMIDTRGKAELRGAAATGTIEILTDAEAREANAQISVKYLTAAGLAHPDVGGRISSNDDVTLRFTPDRWRTWGTEDDFEGSYGETGMSLPLDE